MSPGRLHRSIPPRAPRGPEMFVLRRPRPRWLRGSLPAPQTCLGLGLWGPASPQPPPVSSPEPLLSCWGCLGAPRTHRSGFLGGRGRESTWGYLVPTFSGGTSGPHRTPKPRLIPRKRTIRPARGTPKPAYLSVPAVPWPSWLPDSLGTWGNGAGTRRSGEKGAPAGAQSATGAGAGGPGLSVEWGPRPRRPEPEFCVWLSARIS